MFETAEDGGREYVVIPESLSIYRLGTCIARALNTYFALDCIFRDKISSEVALHKM